MTSSKAPIAATPGAATPADDADILAELLPVTVQIEHFLAGDTTGRALFEAIYDHVLDEDVPERLTAVLRRS
jgi:hypothetical protein